MSEGGGPMPGYNPNAVGAGAGPQPNPSNRLLGIVNDANVGTGMALNNVGPLKGNIPGGIFSDKGTGFKDKMQSGLGIRTRVQFDPSIRSLMDGVQAGDILTAGQALNGAGAQAMGPMPESALTGMGAISPPATPGMGQNRGVGMGM